MNLNIRQIDFTPFLISPRGEMIGSFTYLFREPIEFVLLLPPWGKVGKGIKISIKESYSNNMGN